MIRRATVDKIRYLVPPRTVFDMAKSALGGAVSLVTDQEHRDSFLKYVQKGVIRDDVFFQNGSNALGPILVLGLFQELDDPILKKYGFKAEEFIEGVRPALEQFHNIEKSLDNKLFEMLSEAEENPEKEQETTEGETTTVKMSDDDEDKTDSDSSEQEAPFSKEERQMMEDLADQEAAYISMMTNTNNTNNQDDDGEAPTLPTSLRSVLNWDWKDEMAKELKDMVSPDFFKSLQKDKTIGCMLHKIKGVDLTYQQESSVVENVALLSARVMVVDDRDEREKEVDYDNIARDELNVKEEDEDARMSVAAQIEVLYDIQHSVSVSSKVPGLADGEEGAEGKSGEFTERLIRVGVLEGYLKGGEDGKLRWRLSNVREPWEIPPVESDFDFRPS